MGKNIKKNIHICTTQSLCHIAENYNTVTQVWASLIAQLRIHLQCRRPQFNSWVGKICWRRDRLPTPVFLGFSDSSVGKESACNAGDLWFNSWVQKICWRRDRLPTPVFLGFSDSSVGKESTCNAGDLGSIPRLGRSPGEGKGCSLQYSGLEYVYKKNIHICTTESLCHTAEN